MFAYLKQLASRFARRGFGTLFPPPEDPDVGGRQPRKRGPGGRSSAASVVEPDDHAVVRASATVGRDG